MNETPDHGHDRGPLLTYEIIWKSGHVETVQGHQVSSEPSGFFMPGDAPRRDPRVKIHGEFGGRWRLVLSALEDDIATIRDVTGREVLRDGAS